MDKVIFQCEQCGEQPATAHTGHASLCSPCYSDTARQALRDIGLGNLCSRLLHRANGQHAICVEPYGLEHDHDSATLAACLESGIEAVQRIVDNWESGNLAQAVNMAEDWATNASDMLPDPDTN